MADPKAEGAVSAEDTAWRLCSQKHLHADINAYDSECIRCVGTARELRAAFARGVEAMREKAAQDMNRQGFDWVARAIRALKVED